MKNTNLIALLIAVGTVAGISATSYYAGTKEINNLPVGMEETSTYRADDYYGDAATSRRTKNKPLRDSAGNIVEGTGRTTGRVVEGAGRTTGRVVEGAAEAPGKVFRGIFGRN